MMFSKEWMKTRMTATVADNRRRSGRVATQALLSDRGPVLDLSRGGVRLISKRKLEGTITVRLFAHQGVVDLEGQVQWSKRHGMRQHEVGIKFTKVPDKIGDRLMAIARAHGCEPPE